LETAIAWVQVELLAEMQRAVARYRALPRVTAQHLEGIMGFEGVHRPNGNRP
jgi:hypothetical protein